MDYFQEKTALITGASKHRSLQLPSRYAQKRKCGLLLFYQVRKRSSLEAEFNPLLELKQRLSIDASDFKAADELVNAVVLLNLAHWTSWSTMLESLVTISWCEWQRKALGRCNRHQTWKILLQHRKSCHHERWWKRKSWIHHQYHLLSGLKEMLDRRITPASKAGIIGFT